MCVGGGGEGGWGVVTCLVPLDLDALRQKQKVHLESPADWNRRAKEANV